MINDILSCVSDAGVSMGVLLSAAASSVPMFNADPNLVELTTLAGRTKPGEDASIAGALTAFCNF
uniref:Ccr4-not transcription complex n=1 Tax=Rhizophora mucronata TaxID=61149 RepID=A0A2P2MSD1_RHIMU